MIKSYNGRGFGTGQMRQRKKRIWIGVGIFACLALAGTLILLQHLLPAAQPEAPTEPDETAVETIAIVHEDEPVEPEPEPEPPFSLHEEADTIFLDADAESSGGDDKHQVESKFIVLADAETGEIIVEKNSDARMYPASMTKVLTLLVATEHMPEDADGTFTMTREVADYCYLNECSVVGYIVGEEIPISELLYGCILCSGADACLGLVEVTAGGSHEQFVEWMNEKVEELGLSETTHFTNCVGLFNEEHYTTARDMAAIMHAALGNEKCREILSTHKFLSEPTEQHPDGQVLSNLFLRRIEDQDTGSITVLCGKTGYVPESGCCAVSYGEDEAGHRYLCVTGKSSGSWRTVYDHTALYYDYTQNTGG